MHGGRSRRSLCHSGGAVRESAAVRAGSARGCGRRRLRRFARSDSPRILCPTCWDEREEIALQMKLPMRPQVRRQAKTDLLELAILRADLQFSLSADEQTAHRLALDIVTEAERLIGPDCVLDHEHERHAAALGLNADAQEAARRFAGSIPTLAWHYLALGRAALRLGSAEKAAGYFEQALALQPQDLWVQFYRGKCAFLRGR